MGGVVDFVKDVVETVVDFVVDVVETVVDFVGDVVGFVVSPFGAFDTPEVPDPGSAATGVTVSKTGTNNQIPVVYGYRRVGGNIVFVESNGETNKFLYVVYAVCEGEIYGFRNIIVNDVELPITSVRAAGTVYTVSEGRFSGRVKYQCFNGTDSQGQSSLANETANWGGKQRKLPGIAYVVMRFEWKNVESQDEYNPFSGGIPKVSFDVFGKKVYDVTTHGTGKDLSGTYAGRTKKYEINPASCLLDYLQSPRYGAGLDDSEIDAEAFKIAANKFNQTVNYSNNQSGRAMTVNAVLSTQTKIFDNVKTLVSGARSIMPYVEGRYKLKVEDGGHPTDITSATVTSAYDVTKEHIVGSISLIGESKRTKYNKVIVNYIDPDLAFTNQQKVYEVAADLTSDNNEILTGEFTFHTLTNPAIAFDLAQMIYDKSRSQRRISFTATQELLDVEVGDIIRITDTILDLDQQTFRVYSMKLSNQGLVSIEAAEHDATLYPFTTGAQIELPPSLFLPDSYLIQPYVKELPFTPLSISVPLDPDSGTETNPPPNAPEVGYQGLGVEVFMPTFRGVKSNLYVDKWNGDPNINGIDAFVDVQCALAGASRYGAYMEGTVGLSIAERNTGFSKDLYWMARKDRLNSVKTTYDATTGSYSFTNVVFDGYVIALKPPANTEYDTFVFRSYDANTNVEFTKTLNVFTGTTQSEFNASLAAGIPIYLRFNPTQFSQTEANPADWPYKTPLAGLYYSLIVLLDFQGTTADSRIEIRWKNSKTGEETQDGSKLFDAHGFLFYNYKLPRGTSVINENLEAYCNFLKDQYHGVTSVTGGDAVGGSVIF
jgi:hypothetical protein